MTAHRSAILLLSFGLATLPAGSLPGRTPSQPPSAPRIFVRDAGSPALVNTEGKLLIAHLEEWSVRRQQQAVAAWPAVVEALQGKWDGSGVLFGSPASFSMEWTAVLGDRFLRLRFTNPVIEAEAFYRLEEGVELAGHWFDTRGVIITLRAVAEDDRLVTNWESPGVEEGRTTYRLIDADTFEVIDEVRTEDGWNEFGRATYSRSTRR